MFKLILLAVGAFLFYKVFLQKTDAGHLFTPFRQVPN